jgi:hypothetical protein
MDGGHHMYIAFTEISWEDMDWIHVVQNRDHWQALLSMIMNLKAL